MAFVVGVLGAESTGKTVLTEAMAQALRAEGRSVAVVPEYLREFCDCAGRTPQRHEQAGTAAEQSRRIAALKRGHEVVIADTTALMIAVYSEIVFGDRSLYPGALAEHRRCDLTLLTSLDLPWQADGLQRDGPHVREPVDALLRWALAGSGSAYCVIAGSGPQRLASALAAVRHALGRRQTEAGDAPDGAVNWQFCCERCGDAACERRCLPRLPSSA